MIFSSWRIERWPQEQAGQRHEDGEEDQVVEHALAHGLPEGVGGDRHACGSVGAHARSAASADHLPEEVAPPATAVPGCTDRMRPPAVLHRTARRRPGRPRRPPAASARPMRAASCTPGGSAAMAAVPARTPAPPCAPRRCSRISSSRPTVDQPSRRAAPPRGRRASRRRRGCASRRTRSCPRFLRSRMMSRTRRRPMGSRPDIGSSRNTSSGSFTRAWARPDALDHALGEAPQRPRRADPGGRPAPSSSCRALARRRRSSRRAGPRSRGTRGP